MPLSPATGREPLNPIPICGEKSDSAFLCLEQFLPYRLRRPKQVPGQELEYTWEQMFNCDLGHPALRPSP